MAADGCYVKICEARYVGDELIKGSGSIITGLPWFREHGENEDWPSWLRSILYLLGLLWLFMGVQIGSDVFMGAIETITSKKTRVFSKAKGHLVTVKVWNDTVANLTLMALGSSAPEILLSVLELLLSDPPLTSGELGPSTIVGSAAFNLFVITAVCITAIPGGEVRYINETGVFAITATCSIFAYIWMYLVVSVFSPNIIEVREAVPTLLFFPVLVILAYAADRGYLCGSVLSGEERAELSKDDLAELKLKLVKMHGELNDALMLRLIQKETGGSTSRAKYRANAVRNLVGGKRIIAAIEESARLSYRSVVPAEVFPPNAKSYVKDTAELGGMAGSQVLFKTKHHAVMEDIGTLFLTVVRQDCLQDIVYVDYKTRDGTAVANEDYEPCSGSLEFMPGETSKIISVKIIDDTTYEDDEEFYIDLLNPRCDSKHALPILGEVPTAHITIVDDDGAGILSFQTEEPDTLRVQEALTDVVVPVTVRRMTGSTGYVSCRYHTEAASAIADLDFLPVSGLLEFGNGEQSAKIDATILPRGRYDGVSEFRIVLTECTGGATFCPAHDGGPDMQILTVVIESNSEIRGGVDRLSSLMRLNSERTKIGFSSYMDQLRSAFSVNGEEDGPPSIFDYVMHLIVFVWKVFFALVPPADFCGGWLCFWISLFGIGYVTAMIGDLAAMLGCAAGIPDSLTAVTLVALGTSLPDTFASKTAAEQEPYADSSVGNVTGSNSVNVFLGLGLPWVIASAYWTSVGRTDEWKAKYSSKPFFAELNQGGGKFVVEGGTDLSFSVFLFSVLATMCILLLLVRRRVFGGELGGPRLPRMASAVALVLMWVFFVIMYAIQVLVLNPSKCR